MKKRFTIHSVRETHILFHKFTCHHGTGNKWSKNNELQWNNGWHCFTSYDNKNNKIQDLFWTKWKDIIYDYML